MLKQSTLTTNTNPNIKMLFPAWVATEDFIAPAMNAASLLLAGGQSTKIVVILGAFTWLCVGESFKLYGHKCLSSVVSKGANKYFPSIEYNPDYPGLNYNTFFESAAYGYQWMHVVLNTFSWMNGVFHPAPFPTLVVVILFRFVYVAMQPIDPVRHTQLMDALQRKRDAEQAVIDAERDARVSQEMDVLLERFGYGTGVSLQVLAAAAILFPLFKNRAAYLWTFLAAADDMKYVVGLLGSWGKTLFPWVALGASAYWGKSKDTQLQKENDALRATNASLEAVCKANQAELAAYKGIITTLTSMITYGALTIALLVLAALWYHIFVVSPLVQASKVKFHIPVRRNVAPYALIFSWDGVKVYTETGAMYESNLLYSFLAAALITFLWKRIDAPHIWLNAHFPTYSLHDQYTLIRAHVFRAVCTAHFLILPTIRTTSCPTASPLLVLASFSLKHNIRIEKLPSLSDAMEWLFLETTASFQKELLTLIRLLPV